MCWQCLTHGTVSILSWRPSVSVLSWRLSASVLSCRSVSQCSLGGQVSRSRLGVPRSTILGVPRSRIQSCLRDPRSRSHSCLGLQGETPLSWAGHLWSRLGIMGVVGILSVFAMHARVLETRPVEWRAELLYKPNFTVIPVENQEGHHYSVQIWPHLMARWKPCSR